MRNATSALAIALLVGATLLGTGCGGSDENGSERAVEWGLAPPVGPNWIRISAAIEACIYDQPFLEAPIVEYQGDRVYIELRHTPEDDVRGCALNLPRGFKKITTPFERGSNVPASQVAGMSNDPHLSPAKRPLHLQISW